MHGDGCGVGVHQLACVLCMLVCVCVFDRGICVCVEMRVGDVSVGGGGGGLYLLLLSSYGWGGGGDQQFVTYLHPVFYFRV